VFTDGPDVMQLATPGRFEAGRGSDQVTGSSRADIVYGQMGDDLLHGRAGKDRLFGGLGEDRLIGGGGNDRLKGGPGQDILRGGTDSDRLDGGAGRDRLFGENGADVFHFAIGSDVDRVMDFEDGTDALQLSTDLWRGQDLTAQQVMQSFAEQIGAHVRFDFGGGQRLIVENSDLAQLVDDLVLVS
jgi:Ca2+-binding RTX toxin-like protein